MVRPQDLLLGLLEQAQQNEVVRETLNLLWADVFIKTKDYIVTRTSEARESLISSLERLKSSFFEIINKSTLSEEEKIQVKTFVDCDLQQFFDSINGALLTVTSKDKDEN